MKTKRIKNQSGFTIVSLLMVIVLVVLVYFAARIVSSAQEDNQKQAGKLETAFGLDEKDSGDPSDYEIPDSPSDRDEFSIRSVDVKVEVYFVQLIATLPGTFTGTCRAEVQQPDGEDYYRFVEEIENAGECLITIPISKLDGADKWQFQLSFASPDGKVTGTHPVSTFSIR